MLDKYSTGILLGQKIKDFEEKFLIPNAKEVGWPVLKNEFDYLEFTDSNLQILYKNDHPIGQYIETNFNDTICFSHFIVLKDERHKGYGNLLLEEFYNTHKNRRIVCTGVGDMCDVYDKKLNLKKIKKSFNCTLEFNKKDMDPVKDNINIKPIKFSQHNLEKVNDFFTESFGYHRNKAVEFYLKSGMVFKYSDNDYEIVGILCATRDKNLVRVDNLIADSVEIAIELFSSFLKSLPEENILIHLSIPENDKFKEFVKTFSLCSNENDFVWILDTNLNCTYDKFYSISNATI